jgi:hypothetical protein
MPVCFKCHQKIGTVKGVTFHRFPIKSTDQTLNAWKSFVGKDRQWNPKQSRLCSNHFVDSDFFLDAILKKSHLWRKIICFSEELFGNRFFFSSQVSKKAFSIFKAHINGSWKWPCFIARKVIFCLVKHKFFLQKPREGNKVV